MVVANHLLGIAALLAVTISLNAEIVHTEVAVAVLCLATEIVG